MNMTKFHSSDIFFVIDRELTRSNPHMKNKYLKLSSPEEIFLLNDIFERIIFFGLRY